MSPLGDKDVRRLDVAVNDPLCMGGVERVRDLDGKRENEFGFHRTPGDPMLQRHAIQELHGDERLPVLIVNFVDGADVGVVQSGSRLCLAPKTRQRLRVMSDIFGQEFQGDETSKLGILSLVHDAHPAAAQLLDYAVMRDRLPNHLRSKSYDPEGRQVNEGRRVDVISEPRLAKNRHLTH